MRYTLSSLLLVLVSACATSTSSQEASKQQMAIATDEWRAAYDSRDSKRLTASYAADAALWGTNLKALATTPTAIAEYFKDSAARPDARVVFHERNIRIYNDVALNSGTYTFTGVRDGKPVSIPARFSIAFRKQKGEVVDR